MHSVTSNAVAKSCPRFPDYARGSIYTTATSQITAQEDGYISFMYVGSSSVGLMINNNLVSAIDVVGSNYYVTFSGYVKKGDVIKRSNGGNISTSILKMFGLRS